MTQYHTAALGGTFDHFHKGHKAFLDYVFSLADRAIIGITDKELTRNKIFSQSIEPYEQRLQSVQHYIQAKNKVSQTTYLQLNDIYGPTLTDMHIDVLIVSPLTEPGAKIINNERIKRSLTPLTVKVCPMQKGPDGEDISSTRIRQGIIDRQGFVYRSIFEKDITISNEQHLFLKKPMGTLITLKDLNTLPSKLSSAFPTVAVGDVIAHYCIENNIHIDHYVFDNITKREPVQFLQDIAIKTVTCLNPSGKITRSLVAALQEAFKTQTSVNVTGEEDLAVLPAILLLPLGSTILYGQPDEGVVVVTVSEAMKDWCRSFLTTSGKTFDELLLLPR